MSSATRSLVCAHVRMYGCTDLRVTHTHTHTRPQSQPPQTNPQTNPNKTKTAREVLITRAGDTGADSGDFADRFVARPIANLFGNKGIIFANKEEWAVRAHRR